MVFKKRKRGLALYQSKAKRRRRALKANRKNSDDISTEGYSSPSRSNKSSNGIHNDDISTIPYSNQESFLTKEKELHEILKNISNLSDTIAESISTEYSGDEFVLLMNAVHKEEKTDESEKENVNLEEEGKNIVENIMEIIGNKKGDDKKLSTNCTTDDNYKSSSQQEEHDETTCGCHVPEHLKFAVELINSQDVLLLLIKKNGPLQYTGRFSTYVRINI